MHTRIIAALLILPLLVTSCYRVDPYDLDIGFNNQVNTSTAPASKDPFPPLNDEEKGVSWGQEYLIGKAFSKDSDFYRAITSYRRALILLGNNSPSRQLEINYHIFLSYYFGGQYEKAIKIVEFGALSHLPKEFVANEDLKIALIDCYEKTNQREKVERIAPLIEDKKKTANIQAFLDLSRPSPATFQTPRPTYQPLIQEYETQALDVKKAQMLNAILPGSGYYYVGQTQSAFTSFALNTLFIAAAYNFFKRKQYAAGLITVGFETGWYFGGIHGAGLAARSHNQRLFYEKSKPYMENKLIFPILQLEYTF